VDPAAPLQLATVYVALFTAAPNKAGGGSEVVGNGYARFQTAISDWATTGSPVSASNVNPFVFPEATPAGWGTIVAAAVFDALSGGNMLFFDTLNSSVDVGAGETFAFSVGALSFTGA
jgi:hypothetical protein